MSLFAYLHLFALVSKFFNHIFLTGYWLPIPYPLKQHCIQCSIILGHLELCMHNGCLSNINALGGEMPLQEQSSESTSQI